jgi:hypothetical protein
MRRQFEDRDRLVIYMERSDINDLTSLAREDGKALVEWVRRLLLGLLEKRNSKPAEHGARTTLAAERRRQPREGSSVHTATSNRLTCGCATCTEYRRIHDLPLGGLPKKAKRQ